jgi:ligand-binding sensor domain-containing protein/two-component sensor histidine kinase
MHKRIMHILCLVILAGVIVPLHAQQYPIHTYTMKDGLPAMGITALFQDSRGFLWIGTGEGVSIFDGLEFTNYSVADGLSGNHITHIIESIRSPGTMFISTYGGAGITKYTEGAFSSIYIDTTNYVFNIVEDESGYLWCSTPRGVYTIENEAVVRFDFQFDPDYPIYIEKSGDGSVWISNKNFLSVYSADRTLITRFPVPVSNDSYIFGMYASRDGTVWVWDRFNTLFRYRDTVLAGQYTITSGPIFSIAENQDGNLWLGTRNGITIIDAGDSGLDFVHISAERGLAENHIISVLFDRENSLWIGNYSKGLSRLSDWNMIVYPLGSIPTNYNNSVAAVDKYGSLWVAAESGLYEIQPDYSSTGGFYPHILEKKWEPDEIHLVVYDRFDRLWIGYQDGELYAYRVIHREGVKSGLRLERVLRPGVHFPPGILHCFYIDSQDILWYSIRGIGVIALDIQNDPKIVRTLGSAEGLPGLSIRIIYEDRTGNLWFGDFSYGLAVLSPSMKADGPVRLVNNNTILSKNIRAFIQDSKEQYWVGTRYDGVAAFSGDSIKTISVKSGLRSNSVWCFAEDPAGIMWSGSHAGLEGIDLHTKEVEIPHENYPGGAISGCGIFSHRYLWFAARDAIIVQKFDVIGHTTHSPPVYLIRIQVNGRTVSHKTHINRYKYTENNCVIEYVGVGLKIGGSMRYQYKLEPVDSDWNIPTNQRSVTYAALQPGKYTFSVRALNPDDSVSPEAASYSFEIIPPFWLRWWFPVLVITLVAITAGSVIRGRFRRLLEIERIRSRIARDLHDDIGSGLTRMAVISDVARAQYSQGNVEEIREQVDTALNKISEFSRELHDTMSDVVWSIDPKHFNIESLVHRLRAFAFELCELKNITLSFKFEDSIIQLQVQPDTLRTLLLIFKEAITNIVRHAHARTVAVELMAEDKHIILTITDDGCGFIPGRTSMGNGLRNMTRRAAHEGGSVLIESAEGRGTTIKTRIPYKT